MIFITIFIGMMISILRNQVKFFNIILLMYKE